MKNLIQVKPDGVFKTFKHYAHVTRYLSILLLLLIGLIFVAPSIYADDVGDIDVVVNQYFPDQAPTMMFIEDKAFGSRIEAVDAVPEGYLFAFYVVNGVVTSYPWDHMFTVVKNLEIDVVFYKTNLYAALFKDSNGKLIDFEYVLHGNTATPPSVEGYTKPNMVVHPTTPWKDQLSDTSLTVTGNKVYTLQYQTDQSYHVAIEVYDDLADNYQEYYVNYNAVVTLETEIENPVWYDDFGNVVSYSQTWMVSALQPMYFGVEASDGEKENIINLFPTLALRDNMFSVLGRFELTEDATFIEYGFLFSENEFLNYDTGFVLKSNVHHPETNEFLRTFNLDDYDAYAYLTAYLIYEEDGEIYTIYASRNIELYDMEINFLVFEEKVIMDAKSRYALTTDNLLVYVGLYGDASKVINHLIDADENIVAFEPVGSSSDLFFATEAGNLYYYEPYNWVELLWTIPLDVNEVITDVSVFTYYNYIYGIKTSHDKFYLGMWDDEGYVFEELTELADGITISENHGLFLFKGSDDNYYAHKQYADAFFEVYDDNTFINITGEFGDVTSIMSSGNRLIWQTSDGGIHKIGLNDETYRFTIDATTLDIDQEDFELLLLDLAYIHYDDGTFTTTSGDLYYLASYNTYALIDLEDTFDITLNAEEFIDYIFVFDWQWITRTNQGRYISFDDGDITSWFLEVLGDEVLIEGHPLDAPQYHLVLLESGKYMFYAGEVDTLEAGILLYQVRLPYGAWYRPVIDLETPSPGLKYYADVYGSYSSWYEFLKFYDNQTDVYFYLDEIEYFITVYFEGEEIYEDDIYSDEIYRLKRRILWNAFEDPYLDIELYLDEALTIPFEDFGDDIFFNVYVKVVPRTNWTIHYINDYTGDYLGSATYNLDDYPTEPDFAMSNYGHDTIYWNYDEFETWNSVSYTFDYAVNYDIILWGYPDSFKYDVEIYTVYYGEEPTYLGTTERYLGESIDTIIYYLNDENWFGQYYGDYYVKYLNYGEEDQYELTWDDTITEGMIVYLVYAEPNETYDVHFEFNGNYVGYMTYDYNQIPSPNDIFDLVGDDYEVYQVNFPHWISYDYSYAVNYDVILYIFAEPLYPVLIFVQFENTYYLDRTYIVPMWHPNYGIYDQLHASNFFTKFGAFSYQVYGTEEDADDQEYPWSNWEWAITGPLHLYYIFEFDETVTFNTKTFHFDEEESVTLSHITGTSYINVPEVEDENFVGWGYYDGEDLITYDFETDGLDEDMDLYPMFE